MKTPIADFVRNYAATDNVRFHMPGHKGVGFLGCEALDITEICGADVLYSPDGIIAQSENNASALFGSYHSFYSTEGSTLAIKAMLHMATSGVRGRRPLVLAARNVHKAFVYAAALLDLDVEWILGEERSHLCACNINADGLLAAIDACPIQPDAVYITSPDYLGNVADVAALANACHSKGIPLLVDNAHGAYLAFTEPSLHPLALGADVCCDSAHKTLPVLTGGAYLHVSQSAPKHFKNHRLTRSAMSLFASTSPSYLILQSLDLCNRYLSEGYCEGLSSHVRLVSKKKTALSSAGFKVMPSEPLKLVIDCNESGYTGCEIADILRRQRIECEFSDDQYLVLMTTPENPLSDLERLTDALFTIKKRKPITSETSNRLFSLPTRCMTVRDAVFSPKEIISTEEAEGRICASPSVSCPPAVPITVSGEMIGKDQIELFKIYGIDSVEVVLT